MTIWLMTMAPVTVLQTWVLLWYCAGVFEERLRLPGGRALKALWYLLADAGVCLGVYLTDRLLSGRGMAFAFVCTLMMQLAVCLVLFTGDVFFLFFHLLSVNVYFTGVLMTARFAKDALLPPGALATPFLYNLGVHILPQCAASAALIPLRRRAAGRRLYLLPPRLYWVSVYLLYAALYFGMMYTTDALLHWRLISRLSVLLEAVLTVMSAAFYLMVLSNCRGYQERIEHSLTQHQMELQKAHLAEVQIAGQALRELRHELKNYMFYMNYLIDQGDYGKLREFFAEFYEKEHRNLYEISGRDSFLDAVLQQKITAARAMGVEVRDHVLLPEDEALNNLDLCIVLSNLLDNAMEACGGEKDPVIDLKLKRVKDYVLVVVENTASRDVLRENPRLLTSKGEKELHGIGLRVIREIVGRCEGSLQFESGEGFFRVMLMMKIPGKGASGGAVSAAAAFAGETSVGTEREVSGDADRHL